jgi:8-oxo-dGTP pyrophosphatase MutT (NUDIX family)
MNKSRTIIRSLVSGLDPYDDIERDVARRVLEWIDSGAELFRREAEDRPDRHLVAYFPVIDRVRRSVLLLDHVKAGLLLPNGGHVEPDEDPHRAVLRELHEELGPRAVSVSSVASMPLFLTQHKTKGPTAHTDVSLWYVVFGDERMWIDPDLHEFTGHRWVRFEDVLSADSATLDPAMHRFIRKLQLKLAAAV